MAPSIYREEDGKRAWPLPSDRMHAICADRPEIEKGDRAMLHYPKIPSSRKCPQSRYIAFEKYDGTNLRRDWDRDFG